MKRMLVGLVCISLALVGGCKFVDSMLLNAETRAALIETEKAKAALKEAQAKAEAAVTTEEKATATANLLVAIDRAEQAEKELDKALESTTPSTLESLAGLAGPFAPWILTLAGVGAGVYKHARAKKGDRAVAAFAMGVEDLADTDQGKAMKKKLEGSFEEKGLTPYVDSALRVLGILKKSKRSAA